MKSQELRKKFINFFEERNHKHVASSSLIPDDPSVLLTSAGMQQFKPYFVGKTDAERDFGTRNTISIQKCFRADDIEEVGDETHLTFFEMLGNFSFGGYFKREAIQYAHDFLKEIGVDIEYVTIFEGDENAPKDEESREIWKELGIKDIREENREENFWGPTGSEGPCGPTTEIFTNDTEIWNVVFNEYYQNPDGTFRELETPGVDTGVGFERLVTVLQDKEHIFQTDLFTPLMELVPEDIGDKERRIIADHLRAAMFLISDGVRPSNKEAGYVLRRLIRRVVTYRHLYEKKQEDSSFSINQVLEKVYEIYDGFYPELSLTDTVEVFAEEEDKFMNSLNRGLKELRKLNTIEAQDAFRLYESFGLPYEVIKEVGGEKTNNLSRKDFEEEFRKHQEKSRAGSEKKFGGHGLLVDTGELKAANEEELQKATCLHTATHLLQAALRSVLGDEVKQAGSDITAERLRFDFTFDRKLNEEEVKKVEEWVNDKIVKKLDMRAEEMPYKKAIESGALYFEKEKYPEKVKVYSAVDEKGNTFSKELCGGPHVKNTKEMGTFRIKKQESVAAGTRRIRAVLE